MPTIHTAPWPGPGNSEGGGVDPEGWVLTGPRAADKIASGEDDDTLVLMTDPWPGPGDSEGG
jgi:hypothetical protein